MRLLLPVFFYKYCVIRSPYSRISWLKTWSQLRYLWVHFFATFSLARYRSFFQRRVTREYTFGLGDFPVLAV